MRRVVLAALPFLGLFVSAERDYRPMNVTRTGVVPTDGRIAATTKGFAAAVKAKDGCAISEFDAAGKFLRQLSFTDAEPGGWWLSHDAESIAVVRGTKLHIEGALHEGLERIDEEPVPDGPVCFSPDDTRLAWMSGGRIVVRDRDKDGKHVEINPGAKRRVFEGPLFSGDGKTVLIVTGPVMDASPVPGPDSIEECDPYVEKPVWTEVHRSNHAVCSLRVSNGTSKLVFSTFKNDKPVLRLFDRESGNSEDLLEGVEVRDIEFLPGGDSVLFTSVGRAGRTQGFLVETHRSGTSNVFARDPVARLENEDVFAPVSSGGSFYFVARPAADPDKVEIICSSPE